MSRIVKTNQKIVFERLSEEATTVRKELLEAEQKLVLNHIKQNWHVIKRFNELFNVVCNDAARKDRNISVFYQIIDPTVGLFQSTPSSTNMGS